MIKTGANNLSWAKVLGILNSQRVFIILLAVFLGFSLFNSHFISGANILNIFMSVSMEGIMLIGMTYLIILGEIDLSVGAVMSVGCAIAVLLQPFGVIAGLLGGLLAGAAIGLVNGLIVVKLRINSMPTTLGVMILVNSLVYVLTKSTSIWGENEQFSVLANTTVIGVPAIVFVFIFLVLIFDLILKKTTFGRNVFAVGGNIKAAEYAGIKAGRIKIACFTLTGLLAGLAGVMLVSRYNVASGLIGGNTAIKVITAVLLGGVSLSGGEGSVVKAFVGLLLVGSLDIGMQLLKFPTAIQPMIVGGVLIVTLAVEAVNVYKEKYK